jgi:hypothetical protein
MKKILMLAPAFALALVAATSAEAHTRYRSDDTLSVDNRNSAMIMSNVSATSDSGSNRGAGDILTGRADSMATSRVDANYNETVVTAPCDCIDDISVQNTNRATVRQGTSATSDSGGNRSIDSSDRHDGWGFCHHDGDDDADGGTITTGDAISTADGVTVVNSNVTRIR